MPQRVLLTGSSGLIGSQTVKALAERGHEIITVGIGDENVLGGVDLASGSLMSVLKDPVDVVVHLAAQIPGKDTGDVHRTNQKIDENVLRFVADKGIPLIFASSASLYGSKYQDSEMDESLRCYPEIEYSKQKLASEDWIRKNLREHYILRISAPYGASPRYQGVLGVFCKAAINNKNIVLYGDGSRCQDFVHVADIANLIARIIEKPDAPNGIYNVASGSSTAMKDVAEIVLRVGNTDSRIVYSETQDPQQNFRAQYNIQKAIAAFGWRPKVSLETGIGELFRYLNG